jgi:hypothetical protein
VLFPNREERREAARALRGEGARAWRLRHRVSGEWRDALETAPSESVAAVARERLATLRRLRGGLDREPPALARVLGAREVPADALLAGLESATPQRLEAELGPDFVSRVARAVRVFARPPIRWFPVIRRYAPRLAPAMTDAEITAAAAWSAAHEFRRHHDRWLAFADLQGTVTPAEFVDRVGTAMVRSSLRPAWRLTVFGGFYLLVQLVLQMAGPSSFFHWLSDQLSRVVGTVLVLLGALCFAILGVGWWMRRLAGQATHFYERTAQAQFLALLEVVKGRYLARDARLFERRVFGAEARVGCLDDGGGPDGRCRAFEGAVRTLLLDPGVAGRTRLGASLERAVLLYRDALDGALLCESDLRTTEQVLGNPALRLLWHDSPRVDAALARDLRRLDLSRPTGWFRGPYLWFDLETRATAQGAARRIVEYNRHAIPLAELELARPAEREAYEAWLSGPRTATPQRVGLVADRPLTTAFTILHFLDDSPARDQEVEERFGPRVLAALRRDRRHLVREVYGSAPLHDLPRTRRSLNLHRAYTTWFAQGRALAIPLRVAWRVVVATGRGIRALARAVGEVRSPRRRIDAAQAEHFDWVTAARKIDRVRGPVATALLRLRARVDVEYLGVRLPGSERSGLEGVTADEDLAFLGARGPLQREIAAERGRAEDDVRRFGRLLEQGLWHEVAAHLGVDEGRLGPEHLRAAMFAYHADAQDVRSLLSGSDVLDELAREAPHQALPSLLPLPRWRLRRAFRRWRDAEGRERAAERAAAWPLVVHDVGDARRALAAVAVPGAEEARRLGVRRLAEFVRHPQRVSEQIVTLRIVQTLSLVDLLNDRAHVYRLGGYADSGDASGALLDLPGTALE